MAVYRQNRPSIHITNQAQFKRVIWKTSIRLKMNENVATQWILVFFVVLMSSALQDLLGEKNHCNNSWMLDTFSHGTFFRKRNLDQHVLSGNCNVRYRTEHSSTVLLKGWFGKFGTGPLEKTADRRKRRYLMSQVQELQPVNIPVEIPVMPTKLNIKFEKGRREKHLHFFLYSFSHVSVVQFRFCTCH